MKRDELKNIGLTDEQIEKVMQRYGADVEAAKQAGAADKQKVADLTSQLQQVQADLQKAQTGAADLETVKAQLQHAQTALKETQKANAIRDALAEFKPRDAALLGRLIDTAKVTVNDDGTLIGLREQVEPLKTSSAYLFADTPDDKGGNPEPGNPGGTGFNMNAFLRGE